MKSLALIPILFLCALFCNGQYAEIKIDYDFFLLGTLNDYMGREKNKKVVNRVDEYNQNSKSLVLFIDSVFKDKYQDIVVTTNKETDRMELHSKLLSQKMNDSYFYKPSGHGAYIGEADFSTLNFDSLENAPGFPWTYFDTIYAGSIKEDIFKNDIERISFISGAFIRFGGEQDSLYYISVANSVSKVRVASEQLKNLKCTNVEYVVKKDYIPVGHTVYFTPTEELKNYLKALNQVLRMHANKRKE
jgi:hypothetical protein